MVFHWDHQISPYFFLHSSLPEPVLLLLSPAMQCPWPSGGAHQTFPGSCSVPPGYTQWCFGHHTPCWDSILGLACASLMWGVFSALYYAFFLLLRSHSYYYNFLKYYFLKSFFVKTSFRKSFLCISCGFLWAVFFLLGYLYSRHSLDIFSGIFPPHLSF